MLVWLPRTEELVWKKYLEDKEEEYVDYKRLNKLKSRIGAPADQKRTLDALGLHKLNRVVEHESTPSILGMVDKVKHLVTIVK